MIFNNFSKPYIEAQVFALRNSRGRNSFWNVAWKHYWSAAVALKVVSMVGQILDWVEIEMLTNTMQVKYSTFKNWSLLFISEWRICRLIVKTRASWFISPPSDPRAADPSDPMACATSTHPMAGWWCECTKHICNHIVQISIRNEWVRWRSLRTPWLIIGKIVRRPPPRVILNH